LLSGIIPDADEAAAAGCGPLVADDDVKIAGFCCFTGLEETGPLLRTAAAAAGGNNDADGKDEDCIALLFPVTMLDRVTTGRTVFTIGLVTEGLLLLIPVPGPADIMIDGLDDIPVRLPFGSEVTTSGVVPGCS
jgi:hypothetical protein